jgi:hypothetical protein
METEERENNKKKLTMLAAVPNTFACSNFIDGKDVSSGCGISNSLM